MGSSDNTSNTDSTRAMSSFSLGESASERVAVKVVRIDSHVSYDQWVSVHVSVRAGSFVGEFPADFTAREITSFRDGLRVLYDSLAGVARLAPCEGQLQLELSINGRGAISLAGLAIDRPGTGNTLRFQLAFDQSYLTKTLSDLDAICSSLGESA